MFALVPSVCSLFLRHSRKNNYRGRIQVKHGFWKGYGGRSLGFHTRKGGYKLDPEKVPIFQVPDISDCALKPYVSYAVPRAPRTTASKK